MRTYLVLSPPAGSNDGSHSRTLFLRDGISWVALLFPGVWLLFNRLWIAGVFVLAVQLIAGYLSGMPGFELAGSLLGSAIGLLVALEGRHYRSETLIKRGWKLESVIRADNLDTAEEIYFAGLPAPSVAPANPIMPAPSGPKSFGKTGWSASRPEQPLGLFEHGGR